MGQNTELTPGLYRHFKGGLYKVLGVAEDTETGDRSVVYIPQAGAYAGLLRIRALSMFLDTVERPEVPYSGPRFSLMQREDYLATIK
jgi:hypothetical protein